jgi:sulfate adenylyltransferase subunit 1
LHGDNITNLSEKMSWYIGKPLLEILEEVDTDKDWNSLPARFPVQYVIRRDDKEFPDYRGYAGKVISGTFQVGDKVTILPNQLESTITEIRLFEDTLNQAFAHDSIAISLADEIDISRGSMIVKNEEKPLISKDLQAKICWLSENPYRVGTTFILKHASSEVKAKIQEINYKVDIENFGQVGSPMGTQTTANSSLPEGGAVPTEGWGGAEKPHEIKLNDIVKVNIRTAQPIFYDLYADNKANGAFILIDSQTNATVAVGFLE